MIAPDPRLAHAQRVLQRGLDDAAYGGAVAVVATHDALLAEFAVGDAECAPDRRPIAVDTIFDLASLTKVVAALPAALLLLDRGLWTLDDTVARFIPAFARHGKSGVTLRHLLTHTSGLAAWAPLYPRARTAEEALAVLCDQPLQSPPGSAVVYSDLGMALLAPLVHLVAGEPLATLLARELFEPLGMRETCYLPGASARARCAATAIGNGHEREMLAAAGASFAHWRTHLLAGEVHDGNTHHALEGVSSHAGLFATAGDLARFAQLWLGEGTSTGRMVLSRAAVRLATRPHTAPPAILYGLAWRLPDRSPIGPPSRDAAPPPFMGDLVSARAFGHTGFTGTSLVIDPARDLAVILLTNAVHTDPDRRGIATVRARFHNAVCAAIDGRELHRPPDRS